MRASLLLLLSLLPLGVSAAAEVVADTPSGPLWAAVDGRFAEATDAAVRAALPDPLPPPPLLLPEKLPSPDASRWASAPPAAQKQLQEGILRARERDYGAAIDAFSALLDRDAHTPLGGDAAYWLAAAQVARVLSLQPKRPQPAIDATALALSLHPDHPAAPLALFTLAHLYEAMGDTAAALGYLRRAGATFPHHHLAPRIRYQELLLLERQGAWLDAFRLADEIGTAYADKWVATLARLVYLDHAVATGDATKMVTDYKLLQGEGIDWDRLTGYRYALYRAALRLRRDDLARPLLISLRQDLEGEASAALLVQWGDGHLARGDHETALAAYKKVEVEHGRTAMADLARLRRIQLLYPTTPRVGRLRLTAPLRALIHQKGRPRLQRLARNVWLGLLVDMGRWKDALHRLDRRPLAEPDLRSQGWYEPLYGALFSRVWSGHLGDRPADLLEIFSAFMRQHHDPDTLTTAMIRQVVEALAHEGYMEGAVTLMAHAASRPDATTETRLRQVELLTAAGDPAARERWDALVAATDPANLAPPLRLRLAATGLALGEAERSPAWAASAFQEEPDLATQLPEATYRVATQRLDAGEAAAAEPLLRALLVGPGAVGAWRVTTALAEALLRQDRARAAADLLRPALSGAPSKEEATWARAVIALATGAPAGGKAEGLPPTWSKVAATLDGYLAWARAEALPLAAFRAELTATGAGAAP